MMADAADLVGIRHTLRQIVNVKGDQRADTSELAGVVRTGRNLCHTDRFHVEVGPHWSGRGDGCRRQARRRRP